MRCLFIAVILLGFSTTSFSGSVYSKKWNSKLKNVDGLEMVMGKDGAMYVIATGEEIESEDKKTGQYLLVSSGVVQIVSNKILGMKFKDGSLRTWSITEETAVCDEEGVTLKQTDIMIDSAYSIRWKSENISEAITQAKQGVALSIRKGYMRYKVGDPDGRIITRPKKISNCSCGYTNQEKIKGDKEDFLLYKARHILLKTESEAYAIIKKLDNGEEFQALAKQYSIGPSAFTGGNLGWFRSKIMVKEFATAVENMKENTYSKIPVQTKLGWHVIKIEEIKHAKKEGK